MFARIVAQAGQIELGDTGRIDKDIDRQVAIACTGKFIDEITHGLERIALRAISARVQRRAQLFEQSGISALRHRVGDDGVCGQVSALKSVHSVLRVRMPEQRPRSEAWAANTGFNQCSPDYFDEGK